MIWIRSDKNNSYFDGYWNVCAKWSFDVCLRQYFIWDIKPIYDSLKRIVKRDGGWFDCWRR